MVNGNSNKMNKLLIIPSIDIQNEKLVRVVQGIPELNCKQYKNDPVEMALIWRAENAKCIHIVDFDHALNQSEQNFNLVQEICDNVIIPIQYGGGIKNIDEADKLINMGIFRLIIGSLAVDNPHEFKEIIKKFSKNRVAAAIDVIDNEVYIHGRKETIGISPSEYAKYLLSFGINRFVVTDVERNGMLQGPNIDLTVKIAEITNGKITHSGGITKIQDIWDLQNYYDIGVDSVIIGRALYENKFSCQKIWRVAELGIFD